MKIYRLFPMIWYNSREQEHRTVYGIEPDPPPAEAWLLANTRCDRADCKDPLYTEHRCYTQILLNGHPVTFNYLPEWLNQLFENGYALQDTTPEPNKFFYIVLN